MKEREREKQEKVRIPLKGAISKRAFSFKAIYGFLILLWVIAPGDLG